MRGDFKAIAASNKDYESNMDKPLVQLKKKIKFKGKKKFGNSQNYLHQVSQ